MTERRLLDTAVILAHGVDELARRRPHAATHVRGSGRWWHPFAGYQQQIRTLEARNWAELGASRLGTSSGQELLELAASEYSLFVPIAATYAVGEATLRRVTTTRSGIIPRGSKIRVSANADASLTPIASATFSTTEPVLVSSGQADVAVNLIADRVGSESNAPLGNLANVGAEASALPEVRVASNLFDTFTVASFTVAGGGASSVADETVRQASKAHYRGQYGPVDGAIRSAVLTAPGVTYGAVLDDSSTGESVVYAADSRWGWSRSFLRRALAAITDPDTGSVGFGCAVRAGEVRNRFAVVRATVALRSAEYLDYEEFVRDSVRSEVSSYFDSRVDWYTWTARSLRTALARSDRRVADCTNVEILDAVSRQPIADRPSFHVGDIAEHLFLARDGVEVTFALS